MGKVCTPKLSSIYVYLYIYYSASAGKLSPTSSHLFKLIFPLKPFFPKKSVPPTVILLHPSQPLSHAARLIAASLPNPAPSKSNTSASNTYDINFRSATTSDSGSQQFQWSDSTDVGDFIRDAAQATRFHIHISPNPVATDDQSSTSGKSDEDEYVLPIIVPSYASRTRFIRKRLDVVQERLSSMEELKKVCDREAHRGARRMALSGFGALVIYWAAVARLTFWDFGW
jgi:calcium uniporter protein, mitochondrial